MLVSDVLGRAALVLNDPTYERWTQAELIGHLNDGVLAIAVARPDALATTGTLTLVAGARQSLPASALKLLSVDWREDGRAVTYVERDLLDRLLPTWRVATATAKTKHWLYDNRTPKVFDVYPPAKAATTVQATWAVVPTKLVQVTDVVPLDEVYINPLVEFVAYKAYSVDTEFSRQPQVAAAKLNAFRMMLGEKTSKDLAFAPDMQDKGATPAKGQAQGSV